MADLSLPLLLPAIRDPELEWRKYTNFFLMLLDRRARREVVHSLPIDAVIDPSSACQLSCPYCALGDKSLQRVRRTMSQEHHAGLIDALGDSLFLIHYFNTGEPLLNKNFTKLVRQTQGKEIYSVLSTNLSVPLNDQAIEDLLTCGLGIITVSLDGTFPDTYTQYRRGGDFGLVIDNLQRLVQTKQRLNLEYPLIEWRFLLFKHNEHQIRDARLIAAAWGVDLLELYPGVVPPDAAPPNPEQHTGLDLLGHATSGPAIDRGLERCDTPFRRVAGNTLLGTPRGALGPRYQKCDWLYGGIAPYPDGGVGACCVSNHEKDDLGRIDEKTTVLDVWNNHSFQAARQLFNGGDGGQTVCARCPAKDVQDYQFRATVQAILRNAPEWALALVASDAERFFYPIDFALSPDEFDAIRGMRELTARSFPEIARRLREEAGRRPAQAADLESMAAMLSGESTGARSATRQSAAAAPPHQPLEGSVRR